MGDRIVVQVILGTAGHLPRGGGRSGLIRPWASAEAAHPPIVQVRPFPRRTDR